VHRTHAYKFVYFFVVLRLIKIEIDLCNNTCAYLDYILFNYVFHLSRKTEEYKKKFRRRKTLNY